MLPDNITDIAIDDAVSKDLARQGIDVLSSTSGLAGTISDTDLILMVSGGADSTALALMALQGDEHNDAYDGIDIYDGTGKHTHSPQSAHIVHVNHMLRGDDADGDQRFTEGLAKELGSSITTIKCDVNRLTASKPGGISNLEEAGRTVRYAVANALAMIIAKSTGRGTREIAVATAHNANDQSETLLMSLIHGAGTKGLSSIRPVSGNIVRPLLGYTHDELCTWLHSNGRGWREDATNADTSYMRSWVRHEIMPLLRSKNPNIEQAIARTCSILSEEDEYLDMEARKVLDSARYEYTGRNSIRQAEASHSISLDAEKIANTERAVSMRVLRIACSDVSSCGYEVGYAKTEELLSAILSSHANGSRAVIQIGNGIKATISQDHILLENGTKMRDVRFSVDIVDVTDDVLSNGTPESIARSEAVLTDENECLLQVRTSDSLTVTEWSNDDKISAIGMGQINRSVSGMLAAKKVSSLIRRKVPVVKINRHMGNLEEAIVACVPGIAVASTCACRSNLGDDERIVKVRLSTQR